MAGTRFRIATAIAGIVAGALVAFSAALYFSRRISAYQELGVHVISTADRVLGVMRDAQGGGEQLTRIVPTDTSGVAQIRANEVLGRVLDRVPAYFLVLDSQDKLLYSSSLVRLLPPEDQEELQRVAFELRVGQEGAIVPIRYDTLARDRLLLVARRDPGLGPNISRVVAALPASTADLAAQMILGTLLVLAPIVLLASIGVAYLLASQAFSPVDQLINEVEAISDGRSLHRRLPVDASDDELGRVSATLNEMIARLEGSFAALRRFTADASHELKTPLTVLRADVERAMHPGTAQGDRLVALEEALQEVARMSNLVDSLLTLARADEGRFDLHREPVQLEPLIRDVFETAVILGEEAGVSVTLPLVEDGMVLGDRTRLRQLYLNIVTNALKYTSRGGKVEITLSHRNNGEIAVAVRDTGVGISAADLPHIFDRFWRADRARSRRAPEGGGERGGFGLGLSISQWIVTAHGGTLSVQSRLGRGSIFTVLLPLVEPDQAEPLSIS
ncbi:MAG: ATP-binding region ATPase domain protein [Gemmatimonadetes bacterium]|nr:ATP-binding region ATPase domain protein [Gemmatimonadota bacterium]